ncbi:YeeE/YedE family protein [Lutibaculum baratangense]|uniref:Lipocalin-related protein and Bos/Can/Equ allergen n=1 Tax=Lutibaculum baratangense AMV1 TaxID=631454 RepID=V4TNJ8_9HYPH|nr:YeeE/YedE family protein [Lutibaculum baratangense]ESR27278.1 Lipocalin-related protein and Bos/Can/Equ allergen [Lutibaculum baratangense AMV1]
MPYIVNHLLELIPEPWLLALGGLVVGVLFGAFAQQSRFCLRAAVLEFSHRSGARRLAVWLLAFGSAVLGTQVLGAMDLAGLSEARQLASPQSLSGAAFGGLMFGAGMVLARGCASRLLVLSATGNLRALLSGLVFAVVAQASLRGFLQPAREWLAGGLVSTEVGGNDLLTLFGASQTAAMVFAAVWLAAGIALAVRSRTRPWRVLAAVAAGCAIPLAWWFTGTMARRAFDVVQIEGVTFTGPSANTLMLFLSPPGTILDFDVGLVPGVFLGSFLAALLARELKIEGFSDGPSMRRYLVGAALMGFGGMLAGGCAVGAGVTGASVFALTAWVTLGAIWLSATVTDRLVDGSRIKAAAFEAPAGWPKGADHPAP